MSKNTQVSCRKCNVLMKNKKICIDNAYEHINCFTIIIVNVDVYYKC